MKITTLDKAVTSVIRRSTTLQNDIQQVAIACLSHTKEHGDYTQSVRLIEGISKVKGTKSAKLTQFFEAIMSATYVYNKETKQWGFEYDDNKSAGDINLEMAEAVKWYDFKAPETDTSKELEKILAQLAKELTKSVESGKVEKAVADKLTTAVKDATRDFRLVA